MKSSASFASNTDYGHHRYDVILLINGVPVVQIELKSLGISPRRAMEQIVDCETDPGNGYSKRCSAFFSSSSSATELTLDISQTTTFAISHSVRSLFGVVPQETVVFAGTILDNLKLANPYASFEQIVAACRMAEIHSAVEALPAGYQTEIGERGVGLSGGQRQRLSIAHALPKSLQVDQIFA